MTDQEHQTKTGLAAWIDLNKPKLRQGDLAFQIERAEIESARKKPPATQATPPTEKSTLSKIIDAARNLPGPLPQGVTPKQK
jgi:hypothetical protein